VRHLQDRRVPLPEEKTEYPRIDHLSFGWEMVRDLVTPLILQRSDR
jgi:hypothetical protein